MLIANLLVANLLGTVNFGRYALLQSTVVALSGLAQLSLGLVIAQQVSGLREREPALAGEIAAFGLLVTSILSVMFALSLVMGRDFIATTLFLDSGFPNSLAIAALALPWAAISLLQQGLFNGLERFRDQALGSLASIPFVITLPTIGAYWRDLEGALLGLAAAYFLRSAIAHVLIQFILRRSGISLAFRNVRGKARLLLSHSLPATLSGLATMITIWGGQTLLMRSEGGSAAVGLFAAAFSLKTIVMFIPTQMLGALMPALSYGHAREDSKQMRRLVYFNASLACGLTVLITLLCMPIAPTLMRMFGDSFSSGASALRLLLLATPLEALTITLYQYIQSKGGFWKNFLWVNLPLAFTVAIAAAWLVPSRMTEGLALSWLIGWAVALLGTILAMTSEDKS